MPSQKTPPRQTLAAGMYIRLIKQGRWEFADRIGCEGAVVIAAVTDDRKLVLIEQYRIPVAAPVIELPAGLVGDIPGESTDDWAAVARRELLEETGFSARRMKQVAAGPVSAGFSSESIKFYLATGLKKIDEGGGVEHEEITVHTIPLDRVPAWLKKQSRRGRLIDQKIYAGLYFADNLTHD